MSIKSEISRLSTNISNSLEAVKSQGVEIPEGAGSDELPDLIKKIATKIYVQENAPSGVAVGTVWLDI